MKPSRASCPLALLPRPSCHEVTLPSGGRAPARRGTAAPPWRTTRPAAARSRRARPRRRAPPRPGPAGSRPSSASSGLSSRAQAAAMSPVTSGWPCTPHAAGPTRNAWLPVRRGRGQQRQRRPAARRSPPSATARPAVRRAVRRRAGSPAASAPRSTVEHAQLGPGIAPAHRAAEAEREQLGAQADAERRHLLLGPPRPSARGSLAATGARRRPRAPSRRRGPAAPAYAGQRRQVLTGVRVDRSPGSSPAPVSQPPNQPAPVPASCCTTRTRRPYVMGTIEQITARAGTGRARRG